MILHYQVINRISGKVRTYKTRAAASRAADKADNAHGSYICTVRPVYGDAA